MYCQSVANTIKWLAFFFRLLKVQEVAYLLRRDPFPSVKLQRHELSLDSGRGLGDSLLIQAHHSEDTTLFKLERRFKPYLSSSHIHKPETEIFALDRISVSAPSAHLDIAKRFLTYHLQLSGSFLAAEELSRSFLFLRYSAQRWLSRTWY
jgi:hypothetical protein